MIEIMFSLIRQGQNVDPTKQEIIPDTGKSLSEALNFASINPQYDNKLFMELQGVSY